MALDKQLLEILRCPKCKGKLENEQGEAFLCHACGLRYPVVDGIPNFLVAEAKPIDKR